MCHYMHNIFIYTLYVIFVLQEARDRNRMTALDHCMAGGDERPGVKECATLLESAFNKNVG